MRIDLNADVGESFGPWSLGEDEALIPLVTSVNVAAGAHAGDPDVLAHTVAIAARHGVAVGAHPGYPDLAGFGRRELGLSAAAIEHAVVAQVGAVWAAARAAGAELRHVKAHGALYNRAARDREVAEAVARAVASVDARLRLFALAGSIQAEVGRSITPERLDASARRVLRAKQQTGLIGTVRPGLAPAAPVCGVG